MEHPSANRSTFDVQSHSSSESEQSSHTSSDNMDHLLAMQNSPFSNESGQMGQNFYPSDRSNRMLDINPSEQNVHPPQQNVHPPQQNVHPSQQNVRASQQNVHPPQQNVHPSQQNVHASQQNVHPVRSGQNVFPGTSEHNFYPSTYDQKFYQSASGASAYPGVDENGNLLSPNLHPQFMMRAAQNIANEPGAAHSQVSPQEHHGVITDQQREVLEMTCSTAHYFDPALYNRLALQLGLDLGTIVEWFRNRRVNQKEDKTTGKDRAKSRTRKNRTIFTTQQIAVLEATFARLKYFSPADNKTLASSLGLDAKTVKIWFQNRRSKEKKLQKKQSEDSEGPSNSNQSESTSGGSKVGTAAPTSTRSMGLSVVKQENEEEEEEEEEKSCSSSIATSPNDPKLRGSNTYSNGCSANGEMPCNPVMPSHAGMPSGMMPAGMMPAGMMPAGMMPAGMMPAGMMPAGMVPPGMMPPTGWPQYAYPMMQQFPGEATNLNPAEPGQVQGLTNDDQHQGMWPAMLPGEYKLDRRMQLEHMQASVSSPSLQKK